MKTESLNELRQAVDRLTYTASDLSNAKEDILKAIDHIRAAIFIETPTPKGSFNIYDYTADDQIRPAMCGVFHDGGFKVASEGHILAAYKDSYEPEKEGKIIGKDGREIEGKYPAWRTVIPYKGESERHEIDSAKVYELLKKEKAAAKLAVRGGVKTPAFVRVGGAIFKAEIFAGACKFMDHFGINTLRTYGTNRAAKATAEDGSVVIVMPIVRGTVPAERDGYATVVDTDLREAWDNDTYKFLRLSF